MRIHISLDDLPEFDSFHAMWMAVRGAAWSVTNTPLGEPLSEEVADALLAALEGVEEVLVPIMNMEEPWLKERRQLKADFAFGNIEHHRPYRSVEPPRHDGVADE